MQIISKIKFIPRYLPPIKYFIPKNLKEIHNKLPSRRISRYKRDIILIVVMKTDLREATRNGAGFRS